VHFGEIEAGRIDITREVRSSASRRREAPYPETMNRSAVAEMIAAALAAGNRQGRPDVRR
jgi:hypothetical protein